MWLDTHLYKSYKVHVREHGRTRECAGDDEKGIGTFIQFKGSRVSSRSTLCTPVQVMHEHIVRLTSRISMCVKEKMLLLQ